MSKPKFPENYIKQHFMNLEVGDQFQIFGDEYLGYDYQKLCICKKLSDEEAQEVEGDKFEIDRLSEVFVSKK